MSIVRQLDRVKRIRRGKSYFDRRFENTTYVLTLAGLFIFILKINGIKTLRK